MTARLYEIYEKLNSRASAFKTSEKIMIFSAILFCVPMLFFYIIFPYQETTIKKLSSACASVKARYSVLSAEDDLARNDSEDIVKNESKLAELDRMVLGNDSAIQMINVITNIVESNALDIKFTKKTPQFDRIYEKSHSPRDPDGKQDENSRFTYKLLPIEIGFRSSTADFLVFLHILEGFKNLNFSIKRLSASRTNDGKIEAAVIIEILVDIRFSRNG